MVGNSPFYNSVLFQCSLLLPLCCSWVGMQLIFSCLFWYVLCPTVMAS
jgi:hypothetical protein